MLDTDVVQVPATLDDVGLRELRQEKLLSQEELGKKANVSKTTIVNIETGKIRPYPQTLRRLAEALEVEPAALVEHLRTPRRTRPVPDTDKVTGAG
jgi:transcriptional regulator with XRE-family HTH domain